MNNLKMLSELILNPYDNLGKKTIAIVGNGGISESENAIIDNADCVVRFNNYATRQGIPKTKDPFRCDILFSTFDLHSEGSNPCDVVIGIPYPFKAQEIFDKPKKWYPKSTHWMVNPYLNMKCCEDLGSNSMGHQHPLPSLGTTALWHMHKWDANFYITGFNWYYDGLGRFQDWDLRNKNYPKNWNHNYPKEVEWALRNLLGKNNIIFSDKCFEILKVANKILSL